jgi:hypothetical protein
VGENLKLPDFPQFAIMSGDLDTKRGRDAACGENLEASDTIKEARLIP